MKLHVGGLATLTIAAVVCAALAMRRRKREPPLMAPAPAHQTMLQARREIAKSKHPVPLPLWMAYRSWVDEIVISRGKHAEHSFHSFAFAHALGLAASLLKASGSDSADLLARLAEAGLLNEKHLGSFLSSEEALLDWLERSLFEFDQRMTLRNAAVACDIQQLTCLLLDWPDRGIEEQMAATVPLCGETVLHLSAREGHVAAVAMLLDRKASLDAPNVDGWGAVHSAAMSKQSAETVALLLARGADVSTRTSNGDTALHVAALNGRLGAVKLLLARVNGTAFAALHHTCCVIRDPKV